MEPIAVELADGPVITSVCAEPLMSVPTTVNEIELSSLPKLVMLALSPVRSTNAAFVPIFTDDAAAFEDTCATVLNILDEVTDPPAVAPVTVSVITVSLMSVPVIVNETEDRLLELDIVT